MKDIFSKNLTQNERQTLLHKFLKDLNCTEKNETFSKLCNILRENQQRNTAISQETISMLIKAKYQFDVYKASDRKNRRALNNNARTFLNKFFIEIQDLIDHDLFVKKIVNQKNIKDISKILEDLLLSLTAKKKNHNYKWFSVVIKGLKDLIKRFNTIKDFTNTTSKNKALKSTFNNVLIEDFFYELISWKHILIHKIHFSDIMKINIDLKTKIESKEFLVVLEHFQKNVTIKVNLLSILFNNQKTVHFEHLNHKEFIFYIQNLNSLLSKKNSTNNDSKIMLDPTKGLLCLCYYYYSPKITLQNNLRVIKEVLIKFIKMLDSENHIYQQNIHSVNKYDSLIINLLTEIKKIFVSRQTLDYYLNDKGDYLNSYNDLEPSDIKEALSYQNLSYIDVLTKEDFDIFDFIKEFIALHENTKSFCNQFFAIILIYPAVFTPEELSMFNSMLSELNVDNNNENNEYAGNLISLIFGEKELTSITKLEDWEIKIMIKFFHEILPHKKFDKISILKFCIDKYGGMSFLRTFKYLKKPGEWLNTSELSYLKDFIKKFRKKNKIYRGKSNNYMVEPTFFECVNPIIVSHNNLLLNGIYTSKNDYVNFQKHQKEIKLYFKYAEKFFTTERLKSYLYESIFYEAKFDTSFRVSLINFFKMPKKIHIQLETDFAAFYNINVELRAKFFEKLNLIFFIDITNGIYLHWYYSSNNIPVEEHIIFKDFEKYLKIQKHNLEYYKNCSFPQILN